MYIDQSVIHHIVGHLDGYDPTLLDLQNTKSSSGSGHTDAQTRMSETVGFCRSARRDAAVREARIGNKESFAYAEQRA